MDFRNTYPEYADIAEQIRLARLERSIAIGNYLAAGIEAVVRAARRLLDTMASGLAAESDQRAIEADAFLRRGVAAPHR